jgi:hypothetical protein
MGSIRAKKWISDPIWKTLEQAATTAMHSAAGAPVDLSDREFVEDVLAIGPSGHSAWMPAEFATLRASSQAGLGCNFGAQVQPEHRYAF